MARIAIITWPYPGHIYPTLSIGANLLAKGFNVAWISQIESLVNMLPEGAEFIHIATDSKHQEKTPVESTFGMQSIQNLYENVLIPQNKFIYTQLEYLIGKHHFDYVITDQQAFAGALFAHRFGIPYAVSVTAPATIDTSRAFPEVSAYEQQQVVRFQQDMGCNEPHALAWNAPLTLVYTTQEFLQNFDFPSSYRFIGPSTSKRKEPEIDISAIEKEKGRRPIVLVSMGTILTCEPGFIANVIEAFSPLDIAVVVVANPTMQATWPDNFYVYPYIPQLRVLQLVDAVICHAGHNTVCEALNAGIPLITIPVVHDQSYVATKVQNCGAGIRLKYRRLRSKNLQAALIEILKNKNYRDSAKKIQQSFINSGGEKYAADLIASHLKSNSNLLITEAS